jgi:hypothetical protein
MVEPARGLRQDFGPEVWEWDRSAPAMLAIDGLSPYRFDIQGALFVSQRGEVTGRIEARSMSASPAVWWCNRAVNSISRSRTSPTVNWAAA